MSIRTVVAVALVMGLGIGVADAQVSRGNMPTIKSPPNYMPPPSIYKCFTADAVGFKYERRDWRSTTFSNGVPFFEIRHYRGDGYELVRVTDTERLIVASIFKMSPETVYRTIAFRDPRTLDIDFVLDTKTMRFTATEVLGYLNDDTDRTSVMMIGQCHLVGDDKWAKYRK